jgi:SHS2 domain-containing protein
MSEAALKAWERLPALVAAPRPPSLEGEEPPGTGPAHWSFGTTADVGIGARGRSPAELFEELGRALFDVITDLEAVRPEVERSFTVEAATPEALVVRYLTELLVAQDVEGLLFSKFRVEPDGEPPRRLRVRAWGEPFEGGRHPGKVAVKAATLHRLEIGFSPPRARVILDI